MGVVRGDGDGVVLRSACAWGRGRGGLGKGVREGGREGVDRSDNEGGLVREVV